MYGYNSLDELMKDIATLIPKDNFLLLPKEDPPNICIWGDFSDIRLNWSAFILDEKSRPMYEESFLNLIEEKMHQIEMR